MTHWPKLTGRVRYALHQCETGPHLIVEIEEERYVSVWPEMRGELVKVWRDALVEDLPTLKTDYYDPDAPAG